MKLIRVSPKTRRLLALPLAAVVVTSTYFVFRKVSAPSVPTGTEESATAAIVTATEPQTSSDTEVVTEGSVAARTPASSGDAAQVEAQAAAGKIEAPVAGQTASQTSAATSPKSEEKTAKKEEKKPSCWSAEYRIEGGLKPAQKANFGEREQVLNVAKLSDAFPKWATARLCVRAQGKALSFVRDAKNSDQIRVRSGSGRIRPESRLELSYCSPSASDCTPCVVEKDSFESTLFGESADDAAENEESDVTAQLSPEVRRELARLEREAAPAPITAWAASEIGSSCGTGPVRIARNGEAK